MPGRWELPLTEQEPIGLRQVLGRMCEALRATLDGRELCGPAPAPTPPLVLSGHAASLTPY
jgi:hypothetical protein